MNRAARLQQMFGLQGLYLRYKAGDLTCGDDGIDILFPHGYETFPLTAKTLWGARLRADGTLLPPEVLSALETVKKRKERGNINPDVCLRLLVIVELIKRQLAGGDLHWRTRLDAVPSAFSMDALQVIETTVLSPSDVRYFGKSALCSDPAANTAAFTGDEKDEWRLEGILPLFPGYVSGTLFFGSGLQQHPPAFVFLSKENRSHYLYAFVEGKSRIGRCATGGSLQEVLLSAKSQVLSAVLGIESRQQPASDLEELLRTLVSREAFYCTVRDADAEEEIRWGALIQQETEKELIPELRHASCPPEVKSAADTILAWKKGTDCIIK